MKTRTIVYFLRFKLGKKRIVIDIARAEVDVGITKKPATSAGFHLHQQRLLAFLMCLIKRLRLRI
jgi:hypothetical protein